MFLKRTDNGLAEDMSESNLPPVIISYFCANNIFFPNSRYQKKNTQFVYKETSDKILINIASLL